MFIIAINLNNLLRVDVQGYYSTNLIYLDIRREVEIENI